MGWQEWTRKQFETLPTDLYADEWWWRSLVFFPLRRRHDSGYTMFAIIGVDENGPVARIHEYDVMNFWRDCEWINIDCLWPSRVFHVFTHDDAIRYSYGRVETRPRIKSGVPR